MPRLLTVLGGKGGIGKTTLAAGMLLAAARSGVAVAGLDLDTYQTSLADRSAEREVRAARPAETAMSMTAPLTPARRRVIERRVAGPRAELARLEARLAEG